ncbi:MAG: helix-turn-helix transcriptional regulator, partial [Pyrinomonadaceae bacterium]|nr:helix-turn-helix transcriptional regulator [Phycisphaerales bacterium]
MVTQQNGAQIPLSVVDFLVDTESVMAELSPRSIGPGIRARRLARSLTLERLAELVGCTKSYLSGIENEKRENPPSEALLRKLEQTLGFEEGELVEIAMWRVTPMSVRRQVAELHSQALASRKLLDALSRAARLHATSPESPGTGRTETDAGRKNMRSLDELYRSGELQKMIDEISPPDTQQRTLPQSTASAPSGKGRAARSTAPGGVSLLGGMLP